MERHLEKKWTKVTQDEFTELLGDSDKLCKEMTKKELLSSIQFVKEKS